MGRIPFHTTCIPSDRIRSRVTNRSRQDATVLRWNAQHGGPRWCVGSCGAVYKWCESVLTRCGRLQMERITWWAALAFLVVWCGLQLVRLLVMRTGWRCGPLGTTLRRIAFCTTCIEARRVPSRGGKAFWQDAGVLRWNAQHGGPRWCIGLCGAVCRWCEYW